MRRWRGRMQLWRRLARKDGDGIAGMDAAGRARLQKLAEIGFAVLAAAAFRQRRQRLVVGAHIAVFWIECRHHAAVAGAHRLELDLADPQGRPLILIEGFDALDHDVGPEACHLDGRIEMQVEFGERGGADQQERRRIGEVDGARPFGEGADRARALQHQPAGMADEIAQPFRDRVAGIQNLDIFAPDRRRQIGRDIERRSRERHGVHAAGRQDDHIAFEAAMQLEEIGKPAGGQAGAVFVDDHHSAVAPQPVALDLGRLDVD